MSDTPSPVIVYLLQLSCSDGLDVLGVGSEAECKAWMREHIRGPYPAKPPYQGYVITRWPMGTVENFAHPIGDQPYTRVYYDHKGKPTR